MAIQLTTEVYTSEGPVTGLYFHITEFYRNKAGDSCQFPVKYYTDSTKTTECKVFLEDLKDRFLLDLTSVVGSDKIEALAYGKIGADLKAAGLTPESDGSGSWVAY